MATWVTPVDSQTDPDAPLTSDLAKRWDNNVVAAFEGASGAVRLSGEGVGSPRNAGLPVLTVTASSAYVASDASFDYTAGTFSTNSSTDVVAATYGNELYSGSVRFFASHSISDPAQTGTLKVFLNGVVQSTWITTATTSTARTIDLSVVVGDVVEWRHHCSSTNGVSKVSDIGASASDVYQEVIPLGRASVVA